MLEYGRQQQRSLLQQREQMMTEIRKESTQVLKEIEKKNQEFINSLKSELLLHMTTKLDTMSVSVFIFLSVALFIDFLLICF